MGHGVSPILLINDMFLIPKKKKRLTIKILCDATWQGLRGLEIQTRSLIRSWVQALNNLMG